MEQDAVISRNFYTKASLLENIFHVRAVSISRFSVQRRGLRTNKRQFTSLVYFYGYELWLNVTRLSERLIH
jgi:hypothetical protein